MLKKFIGDKNFYKTILGVCIPIIIQNAVTNFVNLLDNVMVGRVGTDQMNGVAIVNQLLFVFTLCAWGAVSGAGIFTVQYFGKGDEEGVRNTFRAKIVLLGLVLLAGIAIFLTAGPYLISLFLHETDEVGNAAATLMYAKQYLWIMLVGLVPMCVNMAYANTLRDLGETVVPMRAGVLAVIINVTLNYILIFGNFGAPRMGVNGAALATVISRFVEAAVVVTYTHVKKAQYSFVVGAYKKLIIPLPLMEQILLKGAPLAVNEALWALGMTTLNQCYSTRGLAVVGALNIASTITNLFSVVYFATGESISIVIGKLLGANEMEKARDWDRKMIAFGFMCCVVIGSIMACFCHVFPNFYKTEQEVKDLAAIFILVSAFMMPFCSFMHGSYFTLRTGGKTIVTFIFDSMFVWVATVPTVFCLTHFTNLTIVPIYIMVCSLDFIKCGIGFYLLKKGVWLQNIVKEI